MTGFGRVRSAAIGLLFLVSALAGSAVSARADVAPWPRSVESPQALVDAVGPPRATAIGSLQDAASSPPRDAAVRASEAHRRPGAFCDFGSCRPRTANATPGALAFGGAALTAGLLARRRSSRIHWAR